MHNDLLDKAGSAVTGAVGSVADVVSGAAADARDAVSPRRVRRMKDRVCGGGSGRRALAELMAVIAAVGFAAWLGRRLVGSGDGPDGSVADSVPV